MKLSFDGEHWYAAGNVIAGQTVTVEMAVSSRWSWPPARRDTAIAAYPGAGGSMDVEYSISPLDQVQGGTAKWHAWPYGQVAANTQDDRLGPTSAARFTANAVDGSFEVLRR